MKDLELKNLSSLFKAFSDENRLKMIYELCQCSPSQEGNECCMNVGELSSCCDIDLSVVSRHLSKLKGAGIVGAKKKGKEVYYDLKREDLAKVLRELADEIEKSSCCN